MGNCCISYVKFHSLRLYKCNLLSLQTILECCDFSICTWFHVQKLWKETGDVINPKASLRDHIHNLDQDDVQLLLQLVDDNPDYFLDELLHLLQTECFVSMYYTTIH